MEVRGVLKTPRTEKSGVFRTPIFQRYKVSFLEIRQVFSSETPRIRENTSVIKKIPAMRLHRVIETQYFEIILISPTALLLNI